MYFFGCLDRTALGHRWVPRPPQSKDIWTMYEIDAQMQPGCETGQPCYNLEQPLDVAVVHYRNGWTILSFWDRSADTRRNSNGNFIFEGEHDFLAMCQLAQEHFPQIWERVSPLREYIPEKS